MGIQPIMYQFISRKRRNAGKQKQSEPKAVLLLHGAPHSLSEMLYDLSSAPGIEPVILPPEHEACKITPLFMLFAWGYSISKKITNEGNIYKTLLITNKTEEKTSTLSAATALSPDRNFSSLIQIGTTAAVVWENELGDARGF